MWRIKSVEVKNFKGFENFEIDFSNNKVIILGGKNGYGKTTIFDAIELVVTGRIERMSGYCQLFDQRKNLNNDEYKPLIFNVNDDYVKVAITLVNDNRIITLYRQALSKDLRNPVSFEMFSELHKVENGDDIIVEGEDLWKGEMSTLYNNYSFIHYISQEEATSFLKSSQKDRSQMLKSLFNTSVYDAKLAKTTAFKKVIDKLISKEKENRAIKISELENLKKFKFEQELKQTAYISIFDNIDILWDVESPQLTNEDFLLLLRDGGEIDTLSLYISERSNIKQYKLNKTINRLRDELKDLAFFIYYKDNPLLEGFTRVLNEMKPSIENLSSDTIEEFKFDIPDEVLQSVEIPDYLPRLVEMKKEHKELSEYDKSWSDLLGKRDIVARKLLSDHNLLIREESQHKCPLCGTIFPDVDSLLKNINKTSQLQYSVSDKMNTMFMKNIYVFRNDIMENVLSRSISFYESKGITKEDVKRYVEVKNRQYENLEDLQHIIKMKFIPEDTLEQTEEKLCLTFNTLYKEIAEIDDINRLLDYDLRYGKYIRSDITLDDIKNKKNYLFSVWNHKLFTNIDSLEKEIEEYSKKLEKYTKLSSETVKVHKAIKSAKKEYLDRIVNNVEILFFIYSGRIMQDCYYGRGLFIDTDLEGNNLFLSSKQDSHVDALYNMSSGQLVASMIAFTMAINKLYSTVPILAIDDPLQTIDDINMWGLMETIRRDFRDYFMLFSTHEDRYGEFLRYKFDKMGIKAKFYNVKDYRENREE